ncbi:MAG TPA: low temperature requirement protein A, partial [Micromonosporaceae bacterium]|nr:low temperature requirement protein A [Micromonosporaceae bacterium]
MPVRGSQRWLRRMTARATDEEHRAATPLELLFDLCFVVAVAQAGARLHHALTAGEVGHGVGSYLMVFFAIWWAWVNFTWYASAYDTDDGAYRLITLVQMTGALILAAGVPRAFDRGDFTVVVIGYVVMRLALVTQWIRAAVSDPEHRVTALRFAAGITIVQAGWVARLALPDALLVPSFLVLVAGELLVPVWAERAKGTTWHPGHIAERYGLFTLIVLGESILASTTAIQVAFDAGGQRRELFELTAAGLVTVFGMWWLYFDRPGHEVLASASSGFFWGYGHYLVFASIAAVGAGVAVT